MSKGYRITASTGIHKGDRDYQQDQVNLFSHSRIPGCMLGIVADGMGGRSGGRKASDQVMLTAKQLFDRYAPETDDAPAMLKQIVEEAHIVIKLTAISVWPLRGMKCSAARDSTPPGAKASSTSSASVIRQAREDPAATRVVRSGHAAAGVAF